MEGGCHREGGRERQGGRMTEGMSIEREREMGGWEKGRKGQGGRLIVNQQKC